MSSTKLEAGIFTISLDFELIWGTLDKHGPGKLGQLCAIERFCIFDRLLKLFVEYDVSATWCTVGHLFLRDCHAVSGIKHPEIVRPTHAWIDHDWFLYDPCASEETAPLFYGRSLVQQILACPVPQEIGCHSFSHVIFGDQGCSRKTAETELESCVRAAEELGVELRSFVFPRNRVGHLDLLRSHGFECFRGPEPRWWSTGAWPESLRTVGHLFDILTTRTPPIVFPEKDASGLWNLPGSMLFTPAHGFRRYIPMTLRVRRACRGLDACVRRKGTFHLWFHPTDLANNVEPMLEGLRRILEHSRMLRDRGQLRILPMGSVISQSPWESPHKLKAVLRLNGKKTHKARR